MPIRPVAVAARLAAALLFTTFGLASRDAVAAVGAFGLSSPANGAFVNATPTFKWSASTGATSYTLTLTPSSGAPLVKAGLTTPSYAIAAAETLSAAGNPVVWRVTARDDAGNTLDSNTSSFFVDTTPPAAFGLTAPAAGVFSRATDARFTWEAATDAGSGIATYHFYVDGTLCGDAPTAGFSFFPATCNPTDGTHTWAVSAEDVAGNITWCKEAPGGTGGRAIKIDNTGPAAGDGGGVFQIASNNTPDQYGFPTNRMVDTGLNVVPGDQISVTSTGIWCFLGCTIGCYDTGGYNNPVNTPTQACNNGSLIARVGGGSQFKCIGKSATFVAGSNDRGILELGSNAQSGCNDKTVTATVIGGRSFNLVSPAPDAILNQQFPTFSWQAATDQGAGGVTYLLDIDGVPTGATATTIGTIITATSFTILDRLTDGAHTWRVRARDAAGNTTPSTTRRFTVDSTRPEMFRLRMPAAGACSVSPTPSLCWNVVTDPGGVASYQLWIDGAMAFSTNNPLITCGSPAAALAPGMHTWYAVAIDRAGNARQSLETFSLLIDYTPPAAPGLATPAAGASIVDAPRFTWSAATDAGGVSTYELTVDGAVAATVGGKTLAWLSPTDLAAGAHTWSVRAVDACNQGTSSAMGMFTTAACSPDGIMHPCPGSDVGRCKPGTRTCTSAGTWSACAGAVKPVPEICNEEDDNCDGVVDDGTNGCGGVCPLPVYVYTPCDGPDADLCQEGVYMCSGRNSLACVETTPVNVEICNGRDDDCNGVSDDPPVCTAGPRPDGGMPVDAGTGTGGASGSGGSSSDASVTDDAAVDGAVDGTGGGASGTGGSGNVGGLIGSTDGGVGGANAMDAGQPGGKTGMTSGTGGAIGAGGKPAPVDAAADAKVDAGVASGKSAGCACTAAPGVFDGASWFTVVIGLALVGGRRGRARRRG